MKKILLLMFISFISICSSYSQGNGRVVKVIYDGCGYTSGVSTYNDMYYRPIMGWRSHNYI